MALVESFYQYYLKVLDREGKEKKKEEKTESGERRKKGKYIN